MPTNRNTRSKNRDSETGMKQYSVSISPEKQANRPPSMNGINKQLP
ncbi:hypothetical protein A8990_12240 [Paenibacillus taihuensis]|uniref:Uncharacterized protein n=1 Tax=Paenibacillus taihuensis TaxID=1156355 RepID=A0A3D9RK24_9BACL|nr:hypothetical protein [Paenibacillus taihuensis]REE80087.1 hypothetical protein A8990_12240 [Paenibacillus taihuensis]